MAQEQRAHRRLPVDFEAFVTTAGLREHPCRVQDFCLGGALLSFDDPLRPLPPAFGMLGRGVSLEVRMVPRTPGQRDAYSFQAKVARRDKHQLGIAFVNPDPTSLMSLQSLANITNSQARKGVRNDIRKVRHDEATVRRLVGALRALTEKHLQDLPAALLTGTQKAIADLGQRTSPGEEKSRILEAPVVLQRYAGSIATAFLSQSLKPLDEYGNWQPGSLLPSTGTNNKLSLIDKAAFEDWLAVKVMVTRAEAECKEALFELQIRLNELFGSTIGAQNNPVGPAIFFHAIGEPIQKLKLPRPVEQILLKAVESMLLDCLQKLYAALNEELVRQGILPELDMGKYAKIRRDGNPDARPAPASAALSPVAGQEAGATAPRTPPLPAAAPPPERAALAVRQFEMQQKIARQAYATVQRLLAARAPAAVSSVPGATAWDGGSVEKALQSIQGAESTAGGDLPLRTRLQNALTAAGGDPKRQLDAAHAKAAETVDELFGEMLATPLLREDAKTLIRSLDVAFLKLLLADPEFLDNERHPARLVLNRIASLGARGAMTTPQQQQAMQQVVAGVRADFAQDPKVFEEALGTLDRLLEQQRRVYQHNLQRVRQSSEGQHRIAQARRRVARELELMLGGRRVPRAVLTLLDSGWRELLVNSLLRGGTESADWIEQIDVVARMLASLEDPADIDMKAVLAIIKKGLSTQTAGQINRDAVVNDLREMFTALSSGGERAVPVVDLPAGAISVEAHEIAADAGELARWIARVQDVRVGDWMEFEDEEGEEPQQARLAWVDDDRTQFVFVNLQGMKVHDLDVDSLARTLRDNRAHFIDDPETPLVDRGLEAMVRKVYGQLAHRATHDELTGLINRKEFEKRVSRALSVATAPAALCYIDLDQFKLVNGTAGHEAGDELLRQVARLLVDQAGSDAIVARLGGDEFAVLAPVGEGGEREVAEHLLRAIGEHRFSWGGRTFPGTASIGVVAAGRQAAVADALLKSAEAACYAAKDAGRNRVQVYVAGDQAMSGRDDIMTWVSRLNHAIEHDRLQLRCQRIEPVEKDAGLLPHHEILIAIADENGEFLPPARFMQAAERYNRMHALDRWVIRNTLCWMRDHADRLAGTSGFSINLSGQSLNDPKLTTYIRQQLEETGVPCNLVTFEVTETAAISNIADAAEFIRDLQSLGCRFSLDDFGSGLSSYSYLKNLPVDYVKIDGVFVRDIHRTAEDYMMVRSINEMAHFMGKKTIAEYVESADALQSLREIGVDYAQGYGIEPPRPLASF